MKSTDGYHFRRTGEWAEEEAFAIRAFYDRNAQCDAVPGFHFKKDRTIGVAFHCDAWLNASGSEYVSPTGIFVQLSKIT
jgi:ribosome-binding factor A